jgi:hypothetical protein
MRTFAQTFAFQLTMHIGIQTSHVMWASRFHLLLTLPLMTLHATFSSDGKVQITPSAQYISPSGNYAHYLALQVSMHTTFPAGDIAHCRSHQVTMHITFPIK